jgi:predicted branched-subunit amino acid permease
MLIGVVPFGLVAGAAPVAAGLGGWTAVGFSTVVFAGASQLAAVDALAQGGSALVAILTAWTINLRMVLYSASVAPFLSHEPTGRRLVAAYLLTDQAYAVSVSRWAGKGEREDRLAFYVGAGALLWAVWQVATITGVLAGTALPDDVPLDFAIPLVFLVLLVPVLTTSPAVVAAGSAAFAAVLAGELGAGPLSVVVGCAVGIGAGAGTDLVQCRRAARPPEQP